MTELTNERNAPELLPCPFCGGECAWIFSSPDEHGRDSFGIQCSGGTCAICGPERGSKEEAAEAWNRRSTPSSDCALPPLPAPDVNELEPVGPPTAYSIRLVEQIRREAYARGRGDAVRDYVSLNDAALAADRGQLAPMVAPDRA